MTRTVNVVDAKLPSASVKVYVTRVDDPVGKKVPGSLVLVVEKDPELSVAVGSVQSTVVPGDWKGTVTVTSSLVAVMTGLMASAA